MHTAQTPQEAGQFAVRVRGVFRGTRVALHILYGMLLAIIYPWLGRGIQRHIMQRWSRSLLGILNVGLSAQCGDRPGLDGGLLVANHISWLDAIVLNAVSPVRFVIKSDVRDWPILGWLCQRSGNLFVRRDLRRDTARINDDIARHLVDGECIALFPEGTSTAGELPGHFHASLMQGAIDVGAAVAPVAIRYHDDHGNTSRVAAFVGDMSFVASLWQVLLNPSLNVSLSYLPLIPSAEKPRRLLAAEAQGAIHMSLLLSGRYAQALSAQWYDIPAPLAAAANLTNS
jgi:1-acyl-sn-glycerol-3-phosphate acyltransferase